jgi:Bacterial extracellular solute-binding protein
VKSRARRGRVSRRGRERHVRVGLLVAIAVGIAAVLMGTLTAQAVMARTSCNDHPLVVNVAVSEDIAPAIKPVGQMFNRDKHQVDGGCVVVKITPEDPAAVASEVDGQASSAGAPATDAWIPDSSLWVDVAHAYPLGAQQVQVTGITVARSPLMIVMPAAAATDVTAFNNDVGWNFLLPATVGGPPTVQGVRVELPDPTQSAAGLAGLVEVSRLLGTSPAARAELTKFVFSVQSSAQFDDPTSLAAFVSLANPPLNAHPVTVTTEQAVLGYDAANPGHPLAARYPTGASSTLGTPELDYPYVLTSTNPAEQAAAKEFGKLLQGSYTAALVRYYGFRSANGVIGTLPAGYGLPQQPLQLAATATSSEAQTAVQTWQKLQIGSRDLVLIDVSSAMAAPSGLPGLSIEQLLGQVADVGLELFPDSAQIGDWEFADNLTHGLPYKQVVPIGPLPGEIGLISRRQALQQLDKSLRPVNAPAALDKSILAGYQAMTASYQPNHINAVIVLTAGLDNAPGDMPAATLIRRLRALFNPNKPVELIIEQVGTAGNFSAIQHIAAAGDGAAYQVTAPLQTIKVFFEAVSRRICLASGCGSS